MKPILVDYIEVLQQTRHNRKAKNALLEKWAKTDYAEMPDYAELLQFYQYCEDNDLSYDSYYLFEKVQFELYKKEIFTKRNLQAVKHVYHHNMQLFSHFEKRYINLLELGLSIDGNDEEFLTYKLKSNIGTLNYMLHEVPWGVLGFGSNGADLEDIPEMFAFLQETQQIAAKLGHPLDEQLAADCHYYWTHWQNYLQNDVLRDNKYYGFAQYLQDYGDREE